MQFDDGSTFVCTDGQCAMAGVWIQLSQLLDPAEQVATGWPRPVLDDPGGGRRPGLAPSAPRAHGPCHEELACQVCGHSLPATA